MAYLNLEYTPFGELSGATLLYNCYLNLLTRPHYPFAGTPGDLEPLIGKPNAINEYACSDLPLGIFARGFHAQPNDKPCSVDYGLPASVGLG
ncbi:MAG: hypothetical protein ABR928_09555, partial [Terracidiphilus sp.]